MLLPIIIALIEFLGKIAWPIILLIIVFKFKDQIIKLLGNAKKFTLWGAELETGASKQLEHADNISTNLHNQSISGIVSRFSFSTQESLDSIIYRDISISNENLNDREIVLFDYSKLLILFKMMEKIYTSIFGSQIKILRSLSESPKDKLQLKAFYDLAVNLNPGFFTNYSFPNYMHFLSSNNLIIENFETGLVEITDFGRDFLEYLLMNNLSSDLPN